MNMHKAESLFTPLDHEAREKTVHTSSRAIQMDEQSIPGTGSYSQKRRRLLFLAPEQAQRILEAAKDDRLEALYVLAQTTGMRRCELLALTWDDIDLHFKRVRVQRTITRLPGEGFKMSEPRHSRNRRDIPLMALACEALERHQARQQQFKHQAGTTWDDQGLVFCNSRGRPIDIATLLTRSFRPLVMKAELPLLTFHDMRNGAAALLIASGVSAQVVADLLGYRATFDTVSPVPFALKEEAIALLEMALTDVSSTGCTDSFSAECDLITQHFTERT